MPFTALSEAEWRAIRSTCTHTSQGIDLRREIDKIGQAFWAARATREMWIKKLHGKKPAKQREKIYKALMSVRQSQKALAGVLADGLLDDDFVHPDFETPENRLDAWLSDYDLWVQPFAGKNDPIKAELETRLMDLWKKSGGTLRWSRKKDDAGTPYAPVVDFLTLTLKAILGKEFTPSGVAKMIVRHRGQRQGYNPWLMYAMHVRITEKS
ncbi:hypothetical protein [Bradyrhizobium sp. WSM2793]|uniref:hypothetical protein n=1 Tax=Bradyrhizobium sp. WSM2793 TaxID=1038866 RepID=UPI0012FB1BBD|nr:hypothetical protein [Bradyrhizobium sp. WSM2793]